MAKGKRKADPVATPATAPNGKDAKRARFAPAVKSPGKQTSAAPLKSNAKSKGKAPATGPASKAKGQAAGATPAASSSPDAPRTFIVSAGSYERLLYGLSCTFVPSTTASTSESAAKLPYELTISPIFSFPAHLSSLRALAASTLVSPHTGSERKVGGKYLVSGGTDEIVKVWDLKRRKEVGTLDGDAPGTITCLKFVPQRNMLMVTTADSSIALYRVRDWVYLRALKGHKGRVNSIDAHPAGRVALSVGQDKMLRMWDLVAGKAVATMKVGQEGDVVRWNTDGTKFAVICGATLTLYALDMSVLRILTAPSRFHDVRFCYFPIDAADPTQREYMFVACEDGKTRVFDVSATASEDVVALLGGHDNRVKMLDLLEVAYPPATPDALPESTIVLTSISSDGKINFYDLALLRPSEEPLEPIKSFDTDQSRLTCLSAVGLLEAVGKKIRKETGVEGDSDSDSESGDDGEQGEDDLAFDSEEELEFDGIEELESEGEEEEEEEEEG